MKVAHLSSYYVVETEVTTLKCLFTYNRKSLKNPTNFSSTHVHIYVKDAPPLRYTRYIFHRQQMAGEKNRKHLSNEIVKKVARVNGA